MNVNNRHIIITTRNSIIIYIFEILCTPLNVRWPYMVYVQCASVYCLSSAHQSKQHGQQTHFIECSNANIIYFYFYDDGTSANEITELFAFDLLEQ